MKKAIFFLILGAFSLAAQTVLLREYLVAFHGNELAVGFFFASWFFWIAIGAAFFLLSNRLSSFFYTKLPYWLLVYALTLPAQIYLSRSLRAFSGVSGYEMMPPLTLIVLTLLLNLPLSFLTGVVFSAGCRFFQAMGKGSECASSAYSFESLGGFIAGAVVAFLFLKGYSSVFVSALSIAALLSASAYLAYTMASRLSLFLNLVALAIALLCLFPSCYQEVGAYLSLQRLKMLSPDIQFIEEIETPYQVVTVGKIGSQTAVFSNGKIIASFPIGPEFRDLAAFMSVQTKSFKNITIIGAGGLPLINSLNAYHVERITLIEQDKKLLDLMQRYALLTESFALTDKVKIVHEDPTIFFKRSPVKQDLVAMIASEPQTLVANRLFVKEFFALVKRSLNPEGVFITGLASAENFIGSELANYGKSVFITLKQVFNTVLITPGSHSFFVASPSNWITLDAETLKARFNDAPHETTNFPSEAFFTMLPRARVSFVKQVYESPPEGIDLINTQLNPKTFFFNLLVLFQQTDSPGVRLLKSLAQNPLPALLISIALFFGLLAHYQTFASADRISSLVALMLAIAGGASISIQIMLLTTFQARFGALFLQVGLANAIFMAGLALGSLAGLSLVKRFGNYGLTLSLVAAAGFCIALPFLSYRLALAYFYSLFLTSGAVSGALWPVGASLYETAGKQAGQIGAALESYDHLGAFVGAAICGVVILPIAGIKATSFLLGILFILTLGLCHITLYLEKNVTFPLVALRRASPLRRPTVAFQRMAYALAFIAALSIVQGHLFYQKINPPKIRFTSDDLFNYLKTPSIFEEKQTPYIHYLAFKKQGDDFDYVAVSSMAVSPDIRGFAGPINLLLSIDRQGILRHVSLIESNETPAYIKGIDRFLSQFEGKAIRKAFVFEEDGEFDAMSGATVTSDAALRIMNHAKAKLGADILRLTVESPHRRSPIWSLFGVDALTMALALILALAAFRYGSLGTRTIFLLANLLVVGVALNLQFSVTQIAAFIRFQTPPFYDAAHFLLLWGAIVLAVAFGPVYCGYLCPFGALQELTSKLKKPLAPTPTYAWRLRSIKYIILAFVVSVAFYPNSETLLSFDPLQRAFGLKFDLPSALLIGVILLASVFFFRFYCRYLCPVGAFFCLFNKIAQRMPFKMKRHYPSCDLGVSGRWDIDCIQCNRCLGKSEL
jgi:spermidine synthase